MPMPTMTQSNAQNHIDLTNASQINHHDAAVIEYDPETTVNSSTTSASSTNGTQPTEREMKSERFPFEQFKRYPVTNPESNPEKNKNDIFLMKKRRKEKKNEKNNQGWTKSEEVEGINTDINTQLAHIGEPESNQPQKRSKPRKSKAHSSGTPLTNGSHGNMDGCSNYSGSDEPTVHGKSFPLTVQIEKMAVSSTPSSSSSGELEEIQDTQIRESADNSFKQVHRRKKVSGRQKQTDKKAVIPSDGNVRASSLEPTTNNSAISRKHNVPSQRSMDIEQTLPDYNESSFPTLSGRRRSFGDLPNVPQPPNSTCSLTDDESVKSQPIASSQNSWAACVAKGKAQTLETRPTKKSSISATKDTTAIITSPEMAAKVSESDYKTTTAQTRSQVTQAIKEMASSLVVNFIDFSSTGCHSDNALILKLLTDKSKILPRTTRCQPTRPDLLRNRKASSLPPPSKPVIEGVRFLDGIRTENEMVKSITFGFPPEIEPQRETTPKQTNSKGKVRYTKQHIANVESIVQEWEKALAIHKKNGVKTIWLNKMPE